MDNKTFAIRKVNTYVLDFSGEPKTINECVKVGECRLTLSEENLKSLGDLPDPNVEKTYIGNTTILVQHQSGQVMPQRLSFPIAALNIEEAFSKFDEYFGLRVKAIQEEENRPSITEPTPGEVAAVKNSKSKQTKSNIILP